ncbi:hypothetical protein RJ639_030470 [Escallonia herrerae]|uniref:BHLH domain-containing protein n=1 Tax=Escallonia herrerae TaxID=1293975 RepID=A0AA88X0J8_9ASTE|nr:hypothetical protein RJ639_030470 [Escallonia herrerae]
MGSNQAEGISDDFFEQILAPPPSYGVSSTAAAAGGGGYDGNLTGTAVGLQLGGDGGSFRGMSLLPPLGLNSEHHHNDDNGPTVNGHSSSSPPFSTGLNERDSVHLTSSFPAFGPLQPHSLRPPPPAPQLHQPFHSQTTARAVTASPLLPTMRPRVRARRGQATDPHSIAERLRRERIAERMRALQELVPSCNKTDRAAMLDEVVDYVKFLRLQVKVLSMSRLGGTGAVAQLVSDVPLSSELRYLVDHLLCISYLCVIDFITLNVTKGEGLDSGTNQQPWDKWSTDGTEQEVAKLMEEDVGAAMQYLQSKALCIMPMSLAGAIFQTDLPDYASTLVKPESNPAL